MRNETRKMMDMVYGNVQYNVFCFFFNWRQEINKGFEINYVKRRLMSGATLCGEFKSSF